MNAEMKNKLEDCFSRERSPTDCYEALPYMKENLGRINFDDDSDMHDLIDIIFDTEIFQEFEYTCHGSMSCVFEAYARDCDLNIAQNQQTKFSDRFFVIF